MLFDFFSPSSSGSHASRFYCQKQKFHCYHFFLLLPKASPTSCFSRKQTCTQVLRCLSFIAISMASIEVQLLLHYCSCIINYSMPWLLTMTSFLICFTIFFVFLFMLCNMSFFLCVVCRFCQIFVCFFGSFHLCFLGFLQCLVVLL